MKSKFFEQPRAAWPQRLSELSPEDQYEYYVYGIKHVSPPAMELALPLARNIDVMSNLLKDRMLKAKDPVELEAIAYVVTFAYSNQGKNVCVDPSYRSAIMSRYASIERPYALQVLSLCK